MDKNYIQEYATLETTHWWFVVRQKIILQTLQRSIPLTGKLKILNIGVAAGASSDWLAQFGEITSVENEQLFLDYLSAKKFSVIAASIEALPFENQTFDLVCAFDVIEHVEDHQLALAEMFRVCKNAGNVCITVPAFKSLWGTHDVVNGHKRRYLMKPLSEMMLRNQGTVSYASYFNSLLFLPIFLMRKLATLDHRKEKKLTSDFTFFSGNKSFKNLLKFIFGVEPFLLKWLRFPLGVSLIIVARKDQPGKQK